MAVALKEIRKINGFVKRRMKRLLEKDFIKLRICSERDLNRRVCGYLEDFFQKKSRGHNTVRCERRLLGNKIADIAVYSGPRLRHVFELKLLKRPRPINRVKQDIAKDLKKLNKFGEQYPSIRHSFAIVLYDSIDLLRYTAREQRAEGFGRVSIIEVNAQQLQTGRHRKGYSNWRKKFDEFVFGDKTTRANDKELAPLNRRQVVNIDEIEFA